jgi:hypothetical protein
MAPGTGRRVVSGRVSNEDPSENEIEKATREIQDSDLRSHCHVFAL